MPIRTNKVLYDAIEKMLQGLSFWMGYKKECYAGHSIMEQVAVDAAVGILNAHLDHTKYKIVCEYPYQSIPGVVASNNQRVDLVILDKVANTCVCAMEFKMSTNTNGGVKGDIKKMSSIPSTVSRLVILLSPKEKDSVVTPFITPNNHARRKVTLDSGYPQVSVIRAARAMETPNSKAPYRAICIELI